MKLLYLYDTLCGWCYAAQPILKRLSRRDDLQIDYYHAGLFTGANRPRPAQGYADFMWRNDMAIQKLTGQPFSAQYQQHVLQNPEAIMDSWPAALAAQIAKQQRPELAGELLINLQNRRFVQGQNLCDSAVLYTALLETGVPQTQAQGILEPQAQPSLAELALADKQQAEQWMRRTRRSGLPALIRMDGERLHPLDMQACYANPAAMDQLLEAAGSS